LTEEDPGGRWWLTGQTATSAPATVACGAICCGCGEAMNGEARRRRDLGAFLRARRQQMQRADLGLPPVGGRGAGLRREEVSYLSGVSVTWYTWLEQGREIRPSRQVLNAVARALRLSAPEHAYVLSLAGYSAPECAAPESTRPAMPAHVQRLLDALGDLPAYVMASDWTILGWTPAFAGMYPNVATVPEADRNLLWLLFTDPDFREIQTDWEFHTVRQLAKFRAEAGPRLGEPRFARLVERLLEASEHFRAAWKSHDIEWFQSCERVYRNPVVGDLHLEPHRMALSDDPEVHAVIYTALPNTGTAARLRRLVEASPVHAAAGRPAAAEKGRDRSPLESRG
jgi:transcriptional regulator with XRE-family HTH domain